MVAVCHLDGLASSSYIYNTIVEQTLVNSVLSATSVALQSCIPEGYY